MAGKFKAKVKRRLTTDSGDEGAVRTKRAKLEVEEDDPSTVEDDSFLPFTSEDPSSAALSAISQLGALATSGNTEETKPSSASSSLLPDLPKPWRGHFAANSLDKSSSPFVAFHNEILEFCAFVTPTADEINARLKLLEEITSLVQSIWPASQVVVFGSQMTEMLTPTSDMDLAVLNVDIPEFEDVTAMLAILATQIKQRMDVSYVEPILNAKVPIVKFDHGPTGISVDICMNNDSGVRTGEIMRRYLQEFPALRPMLCVLKVYLAQRRLGDTYTGGVGSFVLASMIVSFLQMRKRMADFTQVAHSPAHFNLASLLVGFFHLYGVSFNYYATGISLLHGGEYFNKLQRQQAQRQQSGNLQRPGLLTIVNPDQPDQDMGKNSFLLPKIRRAFEHTYQLLCHALANYASPSVDKDVAPRMDSVLALVIRGDDPVLLARARRDR